MEPSPDGMYAVFTAGYGEDVPEEVHEDEPLAQSLSRSWISTCNNIGNQTQISINNHTAFPLVAKLTILGVTYHTVEIPACEDEDSACFSSGKLPCGYAWYTVSVRAYTESTFSSEKILGPSFSKNAVYGGTRLIIKGEDPRKLFILPDEVNTVGQSVDRALKVVQTQYVPKIEQSIDGVLGPLADSLNDLIDEFVGEDNFSEEIRRQNELMANADAVDTANRMAAQHHLQEETAKAAAAAAKHEEDMLDMDTIDGNWRFSDDESEGQLSHEHAVDGSRASSPELISL